MYYIELTLEEAMKECDKNTKILVAVQNLNKKDVNLSFIKKEKEDYKEVFKDVKTIASLCDDFIKQLRLFTEKQDIYNITPQGMQKIVLLKE